MVRISAIILAGLLAACAYVRPDTAVSSQLDSGVTSSNGGGERALGNQPSAGVTTNIGPAR